MTHEERARLKALEDSQSNRHYENVDAIHALQLKIELLIQEVKNNHQSFLNHQKEDKETFEVINEHIDEVTVKIEDVTQIVSKDVNALRDSVTTLKESIEVKQALFAGWKIAVVGGFFAFVALATMIIELFQLIKGLK